MSRRGGLPLALSMRHNAHYVEELSARTGAAIGRMIAIEKLEPNPDQPRKDHGDLEGLMESVRDKGVLEPLLVRYIPETDFYRIIAGERRFRAARAAGLREVPCIEKDADEGETLELALIENLQRKDLTPFEEADGLAALAEHFDYTHDQLSRKVGRSRSTVTEVLGLRNIPDAIKAQCIEAGILSKSMLLQVARQPNEAKMHDLAERFALRLVNRDQAREERQPKRKPKNFLFRFVPPTKEFRLQMRFRKATVPREEVVKALRKVLKALDSRV
ncbi:MAG: ParB/RepB/Spo0J family partition protein [Acidobacteria bacterium]|nr:ParB/RepB/Spo0J family partition protein [Acidobacteriota bacterium]